MMKQKFTFKLCLAMLGLLLSFSAGAETYVDIGQLRYWLYYDGTASVAAADKSTISGEIVIPASVNNNNKSYSVTTIGYNAFDSCSGLTAITIGNSATTIGDRAFLGCTGLTSITIPNSVTTIGDWAFRECSGLTAITIGNSVTTIGESAFNDCSGLTAITIGNSVTTIGESAFYSCSGLTSITIPNSVTTIGNWAFSDCSGLTSITIPNSVTTIGESAFSGCSELKEFVVETDNPNYSSLDGILYNKQQTEIIQAPQTIRSVNIGNSVITIGNSAFDGCSRLREFVVETDNPNYSSLDGFLYNKQQTEIIQAPQTIRSVNIPNSVITIGNDAFNSCSRLTSITIPNNVTTIGKRAFIYCGGLTAITIGNSVTTIGGSAFAFCSGLTSITIPNSVTTIGNDAFTLCSGLTAITIPNSVTTIGNWAFFDCSGLTAITIPNSVTTIGKGVFYGCIGLTSITIPNSVTTIGESAFSGCSGLTAITIPNSVTTIDNYAFSGCTGLQEIKVYVEKPITITDNVFTSVDYSTCKLYVPQGSIEKYKNAAVWNKFHILALADGSAIEGVDEDKLNVYSIDGKVVIKNLREGEAISICNTTGQNVYQGNETEVPLNKGIYFVKVGTIVSKVMVQ